MIESNEVPIKCEKCQHWFFWEAKYPSSRKPTTCSRACTQRLIQSMADGVKSRYAAQSLMRQKDPSYIEPAVRDVMSGYRD